PTLFRSTETLEQLRENPYLQYFCGFKRYQHERAFAPTLFVKLRERLTAERFAAFEQAIVDQAENSQRDSEPSTQPGDDEPDNPTPTADTPAGSGPVSGSAPGTNDPAAGQAKATTHRGQLVIDASVAEQAIRYPTDVSLLNEARESAESLIDALWTQMQQHELARARKPRTYRQQARAQYLSYSKKRRPGARHRRAARRQQLQYLRRNLGHIDALLDRWSAHRPACGFPLSPRQQRRLWVIRELWRQQDQLHR